MYPRKRLSEISNFSNKGILPKEGGFYNYIGLENIESNTGRLIDFTETEGKKIKSNKIEFSKGMVLYGKLRPYLNKVLIADFDGVATTEILPIECGKDLYNQYLSYYLRSPSFVTLANGNISGARMPRVSPKFLKEEVFIPLPPLSIQSRIVAKLDEALGNIDKQIELLRGNIEDVENMKKSVLENIFTQGNTIDYLKINDFASIKSGKRIPKGKKISDQKTQYPYIRVTDFSDNGSIDLSSIKYISKDIYEDIKNYIITSDDLYISIAGTIGKTGIIPDELNGANLTENAIRLVYKNKQGVVNKYIYYFTISENFKHQAGLATRAVAMPKLAISRLKEIKIYLPNISRQHEIVSYLDTIFDKSKTLKSEYETQIKDLETLRHSLLEEAFAGRLVV